MGRYGKFLFGSGELYGEGEMSNILWALEVDWDGDLVFDGSNEANYMTGFDIRRGRERMVESNGDGFELVRVGSAVFELDDPDDRYNPWNTSSPLYPNVRPGVDIRLRAKEGTGGTLRDVFYGRITDIRRIGRDRVRIEAEDPMALLRDRSISIGLQSTIDVDDAIGQVLTEVGYPYATSLEDASEVISYWWTEYKRSALEIVRDLANTGVGKVFVKADGTFCYYARQHSSTAVISYTDADLLKDVAVRLPWETIFNSIRVRCHPISVKSSGVIWTMVDRPAVGAGQSLVVWCSFMYGTTACAATDVVTPVSGTDYTMNTMQDGSGTNLTSQFTVSVEVFSTTAKLTFTNNSASTGYITLAQLRGKAIVSESEVELSYDDAASQALYGIRSLVLDNAWMQDVNSAESIMDLLEVFLITPNKVPVVQIENDVEKAFVVDLFDRVNYESDKLGIDDTYFVGGIEHSYRSGKGFVTKLILEPVLSAQDVYWRFSTQIGIDSYFG